MGHGPPRASRGRLFAWQLWSPITTFFRIVGVVLGPRAQVNIDIGAKIQYIIIILSILSLSHQCYHYFIDIFIILSILSILSLFYHYHRYFIIIIIILSILSLFYKYYHSFINIIMLLSILSLLYQYYQYFIIITITLSLLALFQKVNIDIGTKILKQKCFGCKTYFFNTHSNLPPAKKNYGSSSIRIS